MRASIHTLDLVLGLLVWSAWFVGLYGGLSLACAYAAPDPDAGAVTWLNAVLAAFTFIVAAWLLRRAYACWCEVTAAPARRRFIAMVATGVYASAAVATLVIGAPVLLLPPCT